MTVCCITSRRTRWGSCRTTAPTYISISRVGVRCGIKRPTAPLDGRSASRTWNPPQTTNRGGRSNDKTRWWDRPRGRGTHDNRTAGNSGEGEGGKRCTCVCERGDARLSHQHRQIKPMPRNPFDLSFLPAVCSSVFSRGEMLP